MIFWKKFTLAVTAFLVAAPISLGAQTSEETTEAIAAESGEPLVMGRTYSMKSSILGTDRRLTVRLPAGYEKQSEDKFPVVYVIDGGPEQDFPHIAGIMQSRELNWSFKPFILVGVETVNRRYQITPPASDPEGYEKTLGAKPGGSDDFRKFLREDVMPWVNARYRTADQNAVIGESLGGLFVVETLLKDPTLFDDYIAVSPSLWWDELAIVRDAEVQIKAMPAGERRLYLTMADEGYLMQDGLDRLVAALENTQRDDLRWTYVDRRDSESHGTIYHVAALDAFRAFYLDVSRTGGANPALYKGGVMPELTDAAKASLKQPCTRETAIATSFAEKNMDYDRWNAMCVLMKPGATATKGNLEY